MSALDELAAFATGTLVSICREKFRDPAGGFYERLDQRLRPVAVARKRLLVQCRQLYVLSQGALWGDQTCREVAAAAFDFMCRYYRDAANGGWYFAIAPDKNPCDRRKDLYAHAFVLFALSYVHQAFGFRGVLELAHDTMNILRERLSAPNGGFWDIADENWTPDRQLRRQNPHMHLLEAMLTLYEATHDRDWLQEAASLVDLFQRMFFDPVTSTIGEFFTENWTPHPQRGDIVEPGHHFEWVWLLHRYMRLSGRTGLGWAADRLFATAWERGFDPVHGGIYDQIDRQGRPVLTSRRIWPVAEGIKACLVRAENGDAQAAGQAESLADQLVRQFIVADEGRWLEYLTADGAAAQTELPGSTPYHIMMAAAEIVRTRPRGKSPFAD